MKNAFALIFPFSASVSYNAATGTMSHFTVMCRLVNHFFWIWNFVPLRWLGVILTAEVTMKRFHLITLGAATLLSTTVLAQQSPPAPAPTPSPTTNATTNVAPMKHTGEWRASKVIGLDIYNSQNEKIGDINEILIDKDGKVAGYVVGVGGFLGMGEHDVLVKMDQIKFVSETVKRSESASSTTRSDVRPSTDRRVERTVDEKWYPDHGIMNATKDQLKALPEFKYSSYN